MTRPLPPILAIGAWLLTALFALGLLAVSQYRGGVAEASRIASQAETRLSEKLAQHDAHLTALAAVLRMETDDPSASVLALADAMVEFYPRISGIATIRGKGPETKTFRYAPDFGPVRGASALPPTLDAPGSTAFRTIPGTVSYSIYKLVDPGLILLMNIDAMALVAHDMVDECYGYRLSLGNDLLVAKPASGPALMTWSSVSAISSTSQPMRLEVTRQFSAAELLPMRLVLPILGLLGFFTWLGTIFLRTIRARQREELRAKLLEQEARLAHAGRVNALGEMASGIAHELAQPVAALLSQSQAARRAATMERPDILERALEANVREARRAGDILDRMRAYIAGEGPRLEQVALDQAITDALRLAEADLTRRGISLTTDAVPGCMVRIDLIAFQQVLHNLLLNAADALAGQPEPRIAIRATCGEGRATITLSDNGPGIPPDALPRVFEPFFTTKPDGMGLGLPLCARLIERMDGSITAANDRGAVFTIHLPCEAKR